MPNGSLDVSLWNNSPSGSGKSGDACHLNISLPLCKSRFPRPLKFSLWCGRFSQTAGEAVISQPMGNWKLVSDFMSAHHGHGLTDRTSSDSGGRTNWGHSTIVRGAAACYPWVLCTLLRPMHAKEYGPHTELSTPKTKNCVKAERKQLCTKNLGPGLPFEVT